MRFNFNPTLWKDIFRTIKNSWTRYLAIIAMTALSATVFIGLQTGVPNLRKMIVSRIQEHRMYDVRISSYTGIRDDDVSLLKSLDGNNKIEYVKTDTFNLVDGEYSIKFYTMTNDIDTPILKSGRLPQSPNEIALDYQHFVDHGDMTGNLLSFSNKENEKDEKILTNTDLTVVGYVYSVDYIMNQRANGQVGDGNYFGFVKDEVIKKDYPDYAIMHLERNQGYDIASDKYKLFETKTLDELVYLFESRPKEVENSIKDDANKELADARKEIEDGKSELQKAREDLDQAKIDLDDAKKEIEDGKKTLEENEKTFYDEIEDAKRQLAEGQDKIDEGQADLNQGRIEYNDGLREFNEEIIKAQQDLNQGKKELDDAKTLLDNSRKEYEDGLQKYNDGVKQLEAGKAEIDKNRKLLEDGEKQLASEKENALTQKSELEKTKAELNENLAQVQEGIAQIEAAILEGYTLEKVQSDIISLNQLIELTKGTVALVQNLTTIDPVAQPEAYQQGLQTALGTLRQLIAITESNSAMASMTENLKQAESLLANDGSNIESVNQALAIISRVKESLDSNVSQLQQLIEPLTTLNELKKNETQIQSGLDQVNTGLAQIEEGLKLIAQKEKELSDNKTLLEEEAKKLDAAQKRLDDSKKVLDDALVKLNNGETELNNGLAEYQKGLEEFNQQKASGQKTLDDALAEIESGQRELDDSQRTLNESRDTLAFEEQDGLQKLDEARNELLDGEKKYQDGLKEYQDGLETFNKEQKDALKEIADGEKKIEDTQKDIDNLRVPLYNIQAKYDNPAFFSYIDQSKSLNNLSYIFTLMFYLVAILVTLTTILRMVETERTQIGTMKALGYSRRTILGKYLAYGLSAGIIGAILGIIIGYYLFMPPVISAYVTSTNLSDNPMIFEYDKALLIFVVTIVLISSTIIFSIMNNLRENAASLMRPKPPKEAKRTLLEKIPLLWNKLSFLNKVSFRNVMRHKIRMLMTIAGVSGSFALIAMAFGLQYSIDTVADKQFGDVYKYQAQLVYDKNADDYEDMIKFLDKDSNGYLSIIYQTGSAKTPSGFNEDINVVATDKISDINNFISLKDRTSSENYILKDGYVIISEKLSKAVGKGVGDRFRFKDSNGIQREFEIMAITEQYFNHQIYMSEKTYLKSVDDKQDQNTLLIKLNNSDESSMNDFEKKLNDYDANINFMPVLDMEETLTSLSESLNVIIVLIIGISALLTFVVLYNLTNINISERIREISTIKVLGFRPHEVASYIFKENYILTFIGMLVGMGLARIMHLIIVYSLSPGAFLFNPFMNPISYLYAMLIVTAFTLLVMLAARREMNRINMVEALKAVD